MTIKLRGITWGHTRGFLPMVATAQRFREVHPEIQIDWELRSLQEFADAPIDVLARTYDLLVIDHPFSGHAAREGILTPLDEWVEESFLDDQRKNSVGRSHESYFYHEHQWALAIDAAAPISGWRSDLMAEEMRSPPETWFDLLDLTRRGKVAVPGIPLDSLMNFYMLCSALGEDPFHSLEIVVEESIGIRALEMLRELMSLCDPSCFMMNPIAVWELLSSGEKVAYCPFAYGYSNYFRKGYVKHTLTAGGLLKLENRDACRSTLGGAGLAISARCQQKQVAADYAQFVAEADCQRTLYFDSGGQPGHLAAWRDAEVNRRCNNFFESTMATLEGAYLRPRFYGYLDFQDRAGPVVHKYLTKGGRATETISELNRLLQTCRTRTRGDHGATA